MRCLKASGLSERELAELDRNSFEASFLDESKKREYLDEVDAYLA